MFRRIGYSLIFVSLVFSVIICLTEASMARNEKLVVWSILEKDENKELKKIAEQYSASTNIDIIIVEQNQFTIRDKFMAEAPTGKGPDIIMAMHTDTGTYAISGMIKPLELEKKCLERFHDLATNSFIYNDKLYGIGYSVESYGLVYNTDLVPKAPETWEKLLKMANELTIKDNKGKIVQYGFLIDPRNFYFTYPLFSGYGGYVFGRDQQGNFNTADIGLANEGSIKAMKELKGLINSGLVPRDVDVNVINDLFQNGKLAMMFYGPWYFNNYRENGVNFDYAPLPRIVEGQKSRPFATVLGFMLSNFSKYPDEAKKFLQYILQNNIQQRLIEAGKGQRVTLNKSVVLSDFVQNNEFLQKAINISYQAQPYPNIPEGAILWDVIPFTIDLILSEDLSVEDALQELEQVMKENIEAMQE